MTVHVVERSHSVTGKKRYIPSGVFVEIRDSFRGVLSRFEAQNKRAAQSMAANIERSYMQHPMFVKD